MSIENSLLIIFAATMLYVAVTGRLEAYVKVFALQGFILCMLSVFFNIPADHYFTLSFVVLETLLLKSCVIPYFIMKQIRENEIFRETEPYIPNLYSLVTVSFFIAMGFIFSYLVSRENHPVNPMYFGISISTIISSIFIIMTRKKLITHVMGYMLMENGIFLLSLAVAAEMPFIVSLGAMLDIFMWVLLTGVFLSRLQSRFSAQNIDKLRGLRG